MATKTFSCRADAEKLAYADALAKKEYGMSFGQYCGTVLLNGIEQTGELPRYKNEDELERKKRAIEFMKNFSSYPHDERIGRMADEELKDLIASRYE